jgi:hypothetical protein
VIGWPTFACQVALLGVTSPWAIVTSKDAAPDCGCCDAVAAVLLLVAELAPCAPAELEPPVLVFPPHPAVNHTARATTRKVGRPRLIRLSSSLSGPAA